jgi:hypothetical protein
LILLPLLTHGRYTAITQLGPVIIGAAHKITPIHQN